MFTNTSFQMTESESTEKFATLTFEPLEAGYGHTLGNALRRVLLSSIPGYAVTEVRIDGVNHQFTTLEGISQDVVDIILNLKQLRFRSELKREGTCRIDIKGKDQTEVTGVDVECEAGFEVLNPEIFIATLDNKAKFKVEMTIGYSVGYSLASDRKPSIAGAIPVDALYSPVIKVSYDVESTRVGRRTDFDKLILHVWTDGTIAPRETVIQAAEILVNQFNQVVHPQVSDEKKVVAQVSPEKAEVLRLTVEELDLPTRIANALRKGGYETVGDLVSAQKAAVAKVKNLGEKSVEVVQAALQEKGVDFNE